MSETGSFWIKMAEKFFGFLLIILSILMIYFTATSTASLGVFSGFFGFLSAVPLIVGVFLIVVKPPE
jgi:uncharacterized integral membrane protein